MIFKCITCFFTLITNNYWTLREYCVIGNHTTSPKFYIISKFEFKNSVSITLCKFLVYLFIILSDGESIVFKIKMSISNKLVCI